MADVKTFLIVDENANNSLFWEMTLKEAFDGTTIQIARTGYEALEVSKKVRFDFFISAWEMEAMSGLVFMQKLREMHKFKHTPFLVFSQILTEADLVLADEFGINNYLLKPFDKARVVEKVKEMIAAEVALDPMQKMLRKIEDYIQEGKINEGRKLIGDCLKPGPHAARAYTLHGDIWTKTDHNDKAEKAYQEALKYDANYLPAVTALGKLYLKLGRYSEATQQFEQLNKRSPKNLERMTCLGSALLGNGEDSKAEAVFRQVRDLDKENRDAAEGLGKISFSRNNLELAAKFFKESGKGDELATYFNNIGIAMVNQGKHDDAVRLYKNAITVLPVKTRAHLLEFNIGLAYKKCNRFGEAAEAFARSVLYSPSYEKAYQGMALCVREAQARSQTFNKPTIQQAASKYKETKAQKESEGDVSK